MRSTIVFIIALDSIVTGMIYRNDFQGDFSEVFTPRKKDIKNLFFGR